MYIYDNRDYDTHGKMKIYRIGKEKEFIILNERHEKLYALKNHGKTLSLSFSLAPWTNEQEEKQLKYI